MGSDHHKKKSNDFEHSKGDDDSPDEEFIVPNSEKVGGDAINTNLDVNKDNNTTSEKRYITKDLNTSKESSK